MTVWTVALSTASLKSYVKGSLPYRVGVSSKPVWMERNFIDNLELLRESRQHWCLSSLCGLLEKFRMKFVEAFLPATTSEHCVH